MICSSVKVETLKKLNKKITARKKNYDKKKKALRDSTTVIPVGAVRSDASYSHTHHHRVTGSRRLSWREEREKTGNLISLLMQH